MNTKLMELLMPTRNMNLNMIRRGFGLKDEVADTLAGEYHSDLIQHLRKNGMLLKLEGLQILLAKEFGFCYGVDRAVDYAYETRQKFPDRTIYITSEIIHNPFVNRKLQAMGVRFLSGGDAENYNYEDIQPDDIVILPAFGASVAELELLAKVKCVLVDTTCGSVMNVWKRVERNARDGYTSIIHGKYSHEETIATSSRALQFDGGCYLIVRDEEETQLVCDYIRNGGDKQVFLQTFQNAVSSNFNPDNDLVRVGLANQTTMLSSESLKIAEMIKLAMIDRYSPENIKDHYRSFDTICSATQERQDAIIELGNQSPDIILVVGGYNSSNTNHLCEIGSQFATTFHISESDRIISKDEIKHKPFGQKEETITHNWLPGSDVKIGVTSGASTPDKVVEDTILRLCECRGISHEQIRNAAQETLSPSQA
jgi:4-hydroxy-3-methylbut-2-en-1-yl diphosphate reductase